MARTDLPLTDTVKKNPELLSQFRQALGILYGDDGKIVPGNESEAKTLLEKIHTDLEIPEGYSVKEIGIIIEKWYETLATMTGAPEYPVSKTTLNSEEAKNLIEKDEREKAERKKIDLEVKQGVEDSIKRQQEIYNKEAEKAKQISEALKNEKIYVGAKKEESLKTENVEKLRQQANANPQETAAQIEKTIRERVPSAPESAVKQTAYDIVANLQTNGEPLKQAAIVSALAANTKNIDAVVKNGTLAKDLSGWTQVLSDSKLTSEEISRALTSAAFGDSFQREVLPKWAINFSPNPAQGYQKYSFDGISNDYSLLMGRQSFFLDGLRGFSVDQVKSQISLKVNSFLVGQIEKLPADSALRGVFDSKIVQTCLPGAGLAVTGAWEAVEGSFFGKIAVGSGFAPVLGWLGEKTGIDFGIKKVAQVAVEKGMEGATGVGVAAGITAAFAWTGPLAPVIGAVGAFVVNIIGAEAVKKIVNTLKDNVQKYGKFVVAGVGALFGFVLGGGSLLGAIIGAGLGFGGATLISGGTSALGASAASFGSGVASVLGAIGSVALGAVAGPILATLLGLPVLIVLILFIINSGAYVVPPSASILESSNPYIDIKKTATPPGPFQNSDLPLKVSYTVTINAKKDNLTNIVVKDDCTVITKTGSQPCVAPPILVPGGEIGAGHPFVFSYDANYNSSYKDALVTNIVTITAKVSAGPQTASSGTSVMIGSPCGSSGGNITSSAANAAFCIVSDLNLFHLNPLLVGLVGNSNWKKLVAVLPGPAIEALQASAPVDGHLQCIGFVSATAGLAYGQNWGQVSNACSYIGHPPQGFTYVQGTSGIKSGDIFLLKVNSCSSSSPGHIGVVTSVDGALISCADANYTAGGYSRSAHGCFELSKLAGYLRKK